MSSNEANDWSAATWAGNRRAQLRRSLALSVRERLQVLEDLCGVSARLMEIAKRSGRVGLTDDPGSTILKP